MLVIFTFIASMFQGWAMGANDAANSHGTAVGSGIRTLKQAIIISSIFAVLGAVLEGHHVIKTIGRGIVPLDKIDKNIAIQIAFAALLGGALWDTIATYLKLPVSITHSSIGGVLGAGLAAMTPINWLKMKDVFIAWIFTPIGACILAYFLYKIFLIVLPKIIPERFSERIIRWLLNISACYMAYTWGSNDVANATGVIVGVGLLSAREAAVLGSLMMSIGIATWGWRVIETIGTRITHLIPLMAFTSEIACAVNVHIYTWLGIPVSTTHSIVGAVFGVGLVYGRSAIDKKIARDIFLAWGASPIVSALLAFIVFKITFLLVK